MNTKYLEKQNYMYFSTVKGEVERAKYMYSELIICP